jgi:glycosyltransferase involved in cell wall biosynthesis
MKIALVLTGGLHPSGVDEIIPVMLALVERLARGHEVHAFTIRHLPAPTSYALAGATVHDLGRPDGRWSQWRALQRALRAHGPFDVVHGHWVDPAGVLAAIAGRRLGIPSLVTCDSGEFVALPDIGYGLQRSARGRTVVTLACRLATRVHVATEYMARLARARGVDALTLPIGIDISPQPTPTARVGAPRLLQVASLNRVKDQITLLRALALVRERIDVHLDLVGADTLDGALQRDAAAAGVAAAVTFHGHVRHRDLGRFYRSAHLYVQSSRHEAAGVSVLEAAAAGLPIVGTDVGYVNDWSPHAARAVPPGDYEALAAAIVDVLQRPADRAALAAAARQRVAACDIDWTAAALLDVYRSLGQTSVSGDNDSEHTQR